MRRRIAAVMALVLTMVPLVGHLEAGVGGCSDFPTMEAYDFEAITVSTTAVGFTSAKMRPSGTRPADLAVVTIESQAVRYRLDGPAPTAGVGHIGPVDGAVLVCGERAIVRALFIRKDAADATLSVTYYRGER